MLPFAEVLVSEGLSSFAARGMLKTSMDYRLVASRVFAIAQTILSGIASPHPAPAAVLPVVGWPRDAGLAVRALAWTCIGPDGWRHRPLPDGLVSRATRDASSCGCALMMDLFYTPPLALPGWGKEGGIAWRVPKGIPRLCAEPPLASG